MNEKQAPISSKQPCHRADAVTVLKHLRDSGHVAYLAGGCVRDELLGITPKDFDVATDAPPQRVRELFINTQAVGAAFGVILVRQGKSIVEVATFRSDDVYLDGRRPSKVHFTNAEEDAKRRDFTINGLFFDPIENKVIDFVNGQADLSARVLRAIGDPSSRFAEDHLRLLRAVRFAARFDLAIEPKTADAIRSNAQHLKLISPERIAEELRMMLAPPTRNTAWRLLDEFGLIEVIFRFAPPTTIGRSDPAQLIFLHIGEESAPLGLALAATAVSRHREPLSICAPTEARMIARAMRQSLRISNDENDDLEGALAGIAMILPDPPPSLAIKKRFLARSTAGLSRRLMRAISAAGFAHNKIGLVEAELQQLDQTDFSPAPLITGDDLTAAGLKPGKLFKSILDTVYDSQLENRISTKTDAMNMAMRLAANAK